MLKPYWITVTLKVWAESESGALAEVDTQLAKLIKPPSGIMVNKGRAIHAYRIDKEEDA